MYITYADSSGKSGSAVAKQYRSQNSIASQHCGDPQKVVSAIMSSGMEQAILVCVDDFVGTGRSAVDGLKANVIPVLERAYPNWTERIMLVYAAVTGVETGFKAIEDAMGNDVVVAHHQELTQSDKAFSEDNNIFETADERLRARDIAHRIGSVLEKKHPLGHEDSQALVVFPDNVPNNTLPIFYKAGVSYNGQPWKALFPRS